MPLNPNNPFVNSITFVGSVAETVTIQGQGIAGNVVFLLPNTVPTQGQILNAVAVNGNQIFLGWGTPISGGSGAVTSVFGRTGAVSAVADDYTVTQIQGAAPVDSPQFTTTLGVTGTTILDSTSTGGVALTVRGDLGSDIMAVFTDTATKAFNIDTNGKASFQGRSGVSLTANTPLAGGTVALNVTGDASFQGAVQDGNGNPGTDGQVLTSTVTGTAWADASSGGDVQNINVSSSTTPIDFSQGGIVFVYTDIDTQLTITNFDAENVLYLTIVAGIPTSEITFGSGFANVANVFVTSGQASQLTLFSNGASGDSGTFNNSPVMIPPVGVGFASRYFVQGSGDVFKVVENNLDQNTLMKLDNQGLFTFADGQNFPNTATLANPAITAQVFNVLNYGAVGDGIIEGMENFISFTADTHGSNVASTVTVAGLANSFTSNDIGKAVTGGQGALIATITGVISASVITVQGQVISDGNGLFGWGTINNPAFINCAEAAQANVQSGNNSQLLGPLAQSTVMHIPSGIYFVTLIDNAAIISLFQDIQGITLQGDGSSQSVIAIADARAVNPIAIAIQGKLKGLSVEGMLNPTNTGGTLITQGGGIIEDVKVERFGGLQAIEVLGACTCYNVTVIKNLFHGILTTSGNVNFIGCILSNNGGQGVNFQNSTGQSSWYGGIIDESSGTAGGGTPANFVVENNNGNIVAITDCTIYGFGLCVIVKDGATLIARGCVIAPFSSTGGVQIQANSTFVARDCVIAAFVSPGVTNFALNNAGIFKDEGNNKIEIEGGTFNATQSGTIVTITTNGAHFNFTNQNIGQTIYVYGYTDETRYNGTWTLLGFPTATTLTFDAGASGFATSTQNAHVGIISKFSSAYTGTPPVIGGTRPTFSLALASLTGDTQMGVWTPESDSRLVRVQISSSVVTTSSVTPILTLSNGNVSKSITLTSGQQTWDSGILTDTFFAQNLPVTVSITEGTNAAAPANLNVLIAYDGYGF